jgi:NADH-quinone oxidoreductase subunit J
MINNPVIFYIASFLIIGFALLSMFLKNIIYSLLAAIMVFFSASVFFYILGSEYNAIIQFAIYGLAVPVIIGLSIMFTSGKEGCSQKGFTLPYLTILAGIIFVMAFIYVIMISLAMLPDTFRIGELAQQNSFEVISAFAKGIFMDYVWAFELLSLLLTVVIAGFSIINIRKKGGKV